MSAIEGWQAGLILGAALSIGIDRAIVAFARWRFRRTRRMCPCCDGELAEDGRALGAIEKLKVCDACGDTWPTGVR